MKNLNEKLENYELKQGVIEDYFSDLNEYKLQETKGELRDNSRNPILPGVLSSRLYLKQLNAVSTWKLSRLAEPLQSFLENMDLIKSRKKELEYAWKLLLKNHPHDSICGCSVDEVHEENISRFKQVDQISDALLARCLNKLAEKISEKDFIICNMSNYNFSGVIKVKTDKNLSESKSCQLIGISKEFPEEILLNTQRAPMFEDMKEFREYLVYTENVPPFSIKTVSSFESPDPIEITKNKISNSMVEVTINPDGTINLKDLENNKVLKNLHNIANRADIGDTYNYSPLLNDEPIKAKFIKSEIAEKGNLRSILKLSYNMEIPKFFDEKNGTRSKSVYSTEISTEIIITAGSKRVEFITSWENLSEDHIMQVKFQLPEKITHTVSENTLGLIEREFDPDYKIEKFIPAKKGEELKTNTAPMQRFVFSQGLGIITEGLPEYLVSKDVLSVTILRSTGKLSAGSLNTRNFPAGPPLDTPEAQCKGKQAVKYALCLTDNPEELFKHADEFMGCIITQTGLVSNEETGQLSENLIKITNENILIYAVKTPENTNIKGIILRLINISQKTQSCRFSSTNYSGFYEVNSLEEIISEKYNPDEEITFNSQDFKNFLVVR